MRINMCGAAALAAIFLVPADAMAIITQPFTGTATITDTPYIGNSGPGNKTNQKVFVLSLPTVSQFDPAVGMLTGATVKLTGTQTQTTVLSGTASGTASRTNSGTNSSTPYFFAPGVNGGLQTNLSTATQTASCGSTAPHCPVTMGPAGSSVGGTYTVASAAVSGYQGTGSVGLVLGTLTKALNTTTGSWSSTSDKYTVTWSGTLEVDYSYLQRGQAAFGSGGNTLTLNLGQVYAGKPAPSAMFDILNLLASDPNADGRLAVSYDALTGSSSGDTSRFFFDHAFTDVAGLAAGSSDVFTVSMKTDKTGHYSAWYTLGFTDALGAIAGDTLSLHVVGTVVPEPGSLALLGSGLALFGVWRRRRSRKS